ncbi:hypothetical protein B0H14DRAFT_1156708 [Mycena olivaceomarginata]|nr:hypothetical protein B0H14DRAFT_1156708 [Mycena olivaceomarginata]
MNVSPGFGVSRPPEEGGMGWVGGGRGLFFASFSGNCNLKLISLLSLLAAVGLSLGSRARTHARFWPPTVAAMWTPSLPNLTRGAPRLRDCRSGQKSTRRSLSPSSISRLRPSSASTSSSTVPAARRLLHRHSYNGAICCSIHARAGRDLTRCTRYMPHALGRLNAAFVCGYCSCSFPESSPISSFDSISRRLRH